MKCEFLTWWSVSSHPNVQATLPLVTFVFLSFKYSINNGYCFITFRYPWFIWGKLSSVLLCRVSCARSLSKTILFFIYYGVLYYTQTSIFLFLPDETALSNNTVFDSSLFLKQRNTNISLSLVFSPLQTWEKETFFYFKQKVADGWERRFLVRRALLHPFQDLIYPSSEGKNCVLWLKLIKLTVIIFPISTVDTQAIDIIILRSYSLAMRLWVDGVLKYFKVGKFSRRISYSTSKEMETAV